MEFYQDLYIPEIRKVSFSLPHVRILGTHHCGNTHREAFKRRLFFQDMLCPRDYAEHVVSRFSHQIQSE